MASDSRPDPSRRLAGRRGRIADATRELSIVDLTNALLERLEGAEGADETAALGDNTASLLGLLAARLDLACADRVENRFGHAQSWIHHLRLHPDVDEGALAGRVVLELGCGGLNPIAGVAELLVRGMRVRSLDLDGIESESLAARRAYWSLLDHAARSGLYPPHGIEWTDLRDGRLDAIPDELWRYIAAPAERTRLGDASVDVSVSNSFFEHVPDPDAVLAELARVTRPGGFAIHRIDYRDHWSYGDARVHALEFLTDASADPLVHGCNRLRHGDFLARFEAAGFTVRRVDVHHRVDDLDDAFRARLAPAYRDRAAEDLAVLQADVFLRKQN